MANKCTFRKNNGDSCNVDAQVGKTFCVFHDPARVSDGRRARRTGGIARTRVTAVLPSDTPDHGLRNPKEVSDLLADSINRLRRGQLDPRIANALGYLASVLLRSLEQGPLEERMARLEASLGLRPNTPRNSCSQPHWGTSMSHACRTLDANCATGAGGQGSPEIRSRMHLGWPIVLATGTKQVHPEQSPANHESRKGAEQKMPTRAMLNRIQAEKAAKAEFRFAPECICFPEKEQPFFCDPFEEQIAAKVKCSLHGNRFKQPIYHIYVSKWRSGREPARRKTLSAQYRKAWEVTFSMDRLPGERASGGMPR